MKTDRNTNKEFENITKIKKDLPKESYIKYLEKVIKIQLKYISRLNKLKWLKQNLKRLWEIKVLKLLLVMVMVIH